jgi:hypothetical protein
MNDRELSKRERVGLLLVSLIGSVILYFVFR